MIAACVTIRSIFEIEVELTVDGAHVRSVLFSNIEDAAYGAYVMLTHEREAMTGKVETGRKLREEQRGKHDGQS